MIANMEAYKTAKSIREVVSEVTDLSEEELDRVLGARKHDGGSAGSVVRSG